MSRVFFFEEDHMIHSRRGRWVRIMKDDGVDVRFYFRIYILGGVDLAEEPNIYAMV